MAAGPDWALAPAIAAKEPEFPQAAMSDRSLLSATFIRSFSNSVQFGGSGLFCHNLG
jgi:hypothetical protein